MGGTPGREVGLADGNRASVGDLVITRHNNRTLRSRGGDWVKNGDRWHVTNVHRDGSTTAQHLRTHKSVRLPALKGHLLQLATTGLDPVDVLRDAISQGNIDDARDVAALLDWRIDPTRHLPDGPLPWLPVSPPNFPTTRPGGPTSPPRPTSSATSPSRSAPPSPTSRRHGWAKSTPRCPNRWPAT